MRHCCYLKVWYRRLLDFFAPWCGHFAHLLSLYSPFSKVASAEAYFMGLPPLVLKQTLENPKTQGNNIPQKVP